MTESRPPAAFWALAAAGALLRIGLFLAVPHVLAGDAWHNHRIALNLLEGHGFSHSPVAPWYPDALRSPAYIFLVLVPCYLLAGPNPAAVALLQGGLDLVSGWLLYRIVAQKVSNRAGLLACGLFLLAPYEALWSSLELTETLSTCLLTAWLLGLQRSPWLGGVAGGLMGLCRPGFLPLVALSPWLVSEPIPWCTRLLAYWLLPALMLTPWMLRNELAFGRFSPTNVASLGVSLYFGVAVDGGAHLTQDGQAELAIELQQWSREHDVPADTIVAVDKRLRDIALAAIRTHPLGYAEQVVRQAGRLWWEADDGVADYRPDAPQDRLVLLATLIPWFQRALLALAVAGLVQGHLPCRSTGLVVVAVMTLTYALIHVEPRYMVPAEPVVAALAASVFLSKRPDVDCGAGLETKG